MFRKINKFRGFLIIRLNEPGVAGRVLEERHEGGCKSIF
jgi:hypothetical protein